MSETEILKHHIDRHESEIRGMTSGINKLVISITKLAGKHEVLIEKLDTYITDLKDTNKRVSALEKTVGEASFSKGLIKYWPMAAGALFLSFLFGVVVDDLKVVKSMANTVQLK